MKVKKFKVEICKREEIREFIEKWHYSHDINGLRISHCFKLLYETKHPFFDTAYDNIIGAMIYGGFAMANNWRKYSDKEEDVIELRRLCCIDDTPKNTESYFIGKTLKWLGRNTNIKRVISYADEQYGHKGVIYKASNFEYLGITSKGKIINYNGKIYHDKTIRAKRPYAKKIKKALDNGTAFYQKTKGKHIYSYYLRRTNG